MTVYKAQIAQFAGGNSGKAGYARGDKKVYLGKAAGF
jgi:hypothetical protein